MELKPQDLVVLLKQAAQPDAKWTYASLGEALGMSPSQVHRSVQRSLLAGLARTQARGSWQVVSTALHEFAVHGARYAFPAVAGPVSRGVPTSFGVPPLSSAIRSAPEEVPVWPHPAGDRRGPSLSPLSESAPEAALRDPKLHGLLALLDALRAGRARERTIAARLLAEALEVHRAS